MINADPVNHQTADTLAEVLDKPNAPMLKQILRTLGHERCTAILEDIRTDTTPYTALRLWHAIFLSCSIVVSMKPHY
jgi:hypothetical protein